MCLHICLCLYVFVCIYMYVCPCLWFACLIDYQGGRSAEGAEAQECGGVPQLL